MCAHYREKKQPIMDAFSRVADSMALLAEQYITMGVDAVMYAALGGEDYYFNDDEFADLVAPLDKMIMGAVKSTGGYCFLHICKKNLAMNRYKSYTDYFDVVNWGIYEVPMTLKQGKAIFPGKTVMGGLANRSGILVEGPIKELQSTVKDIIIDMGKTDFILGADCTLPTNLSSERIRAAIMAVREI
jgi:uroporphyrinogen decarboxylase